MMNSSSRWIPEPILSGIPYRQRRTPVAATESVVIIRFPQSSQAYQALSELRSVAGSPNSLEVRSAALVERKPDGTLNVPEGDDAVIGVGAASGGLIGMLAGVIGGPLGVLL